ENNHDHDIVMYDNSNESASKDLLHSAASPEPMEIDDPLKMDRVESIYQGESEFDHKYVANHKPNFNADHTITNSIIPTEIKDIPRTGLSVFMDKLTLNSDSGHPRTDNATWPNP